MVNLGEAFCLSSQPSLSVSVICSILTTYEPLLSQFTSTYVCMYTIIEQELHAPYPVLLEVNGFLQLRHHSCIENNAVLRAGVAFFFLLACCLKCFPHFVLAFSAWMQIICSQADCYLWMPATGNHEILQISTCCELCNMLPCFFLPSHTGGPAE